jgi:hypothetical protein
MIVGRLLNQSLAGWRCNRLIAPARQRNALERSSARIVDVKRSFQRTLFDRIKSDREGALGSRRNAAATVVRLREAGVIRAFQVDVADGERRAARCS